MVEVHTDSDVGAPTGAVVGVLVELNANPFLVFSLFVHKEYSGRPTGLGVQFGLVCEVCADKPVLSSDKQFDRK